jgi:hypothetical protein
VKLLHERERPIRIGGLRNYRYTVPGQNKLDCIQPKWMGVE